MQSRIVLDSLAKRKQWRAHSNNNEDYSSSKAIVFVSAASRRINLGYTTGTCAQAAAGASAKMLLTNRLIDAIEVEVPSKARLKLKLIDCKIGRNFACCAVIKDSGDDIDVTDGAKIYAKVSLSKNKGVLVTGGQGVGRVTKPGLAVSVGQYAINPVPRQMIIKEVTPYLPKDKGIKVVISVPGGRELAKRTFNGRLGIVGGISIIGTTGIVEPKSIDAYKASLSLQLDVLKASGLKKAVFVLGYVGEMFCGQNLRYSPDAIIKIGDHIGFMLKECVRKDMLRVTLIGYIGKLVKLVNGQFDTNIRFGDKRIETIARYAKASGAKEKVTKDLLRQLTTEAAVEILKDNGLIGACDKIAKDIVAKINEFTDNKLMVNCLLLSLKSELLASFPHFPPSHLRGATSCATLSHLVGGKVGSVGSVGSGYTRIK